ncbi:MAG TPA: sensor histidine kinase [Pyrinomonadaceae bacterium]|nr:sensor histidine kinase [Pyrinomonadaceae bacterium]
MSKQPPQQPQNRWRWRTGHTVFVCFTFFGLLGVPQIYLYFGDSPDRAYLFFSLFRNFLGLYVWAALTPVIFWLGRRFPVERHNLPRRLALHFALSLPCAFCQTLVDLMATLLLRPGPTPPLAPFFGSVSKAFLLNMTTNGVIFYASILAVGQATNYFRKYRERELDLAQAELQALKAQLHPHFLFNTLNAISELVYDKPELADRTIAKLSDLLRLTLKSGRAQEVRLKEELDFVGRYLEIHQTLMQERLRVRWEVDDEALDACVPNMILQPLVENSIRHGIAPRAGGGTIEVVARRRGELLHLRVEDDGLGLPRRSRGGARSGLGLSNTRERLAHLYDGAHRFELRQTKGGGLTVSILIPYRESEDKEEDEDTDTHR